MSGQRGSCNRHLRYEIISLSHYEWYNGHSEYLRLFSVFVITTGGLLLRKMLRILFQPTKFVYQLRHQAELAVKCGSRKWAKALLELMSLDFLVNLQRTTKGNVHLLGNQRPLK